MQGAAPSPGAPAPYLLPLRRSPHETHAFYQQFGASAEVLSVDPCVVYVRGFASEEDCAAMLRSAGELEWQHSSVRVEGTVTEKEVDDRIRTSSTCWVRTGSDAAAQRVLDHMELKAAAAMELPTAFAENWQMARYERGQQYKVHTDTVDEFNTLRCGGRVATLILYLNDDFDGGCTTFPLLGIEPVRPETGAALIFHNVLAPETEPHGMRTDSRVAHCGEPVERGAKVIQTKFFHPRPYPDG